MNLPPYDYLTDIFDFGNATSLESALGNITYARSVSWMAKITLVAL